jgi:hypothetical protein
MAADLAARLTAFGLPYAPLQESALSETLIPFDVPPLVVEIRQHEETVPLREVGGEAYVVHPYRTPTGSWSSVFETMLRQRKGVAVSLYLEPTQLTAQEWEGLQEAAYLAQNLASGDIPVYSGTIRLRDPQAGQVRRIYETLISRLSDPFLVLVQVASPDFSTADIVARSFGVAITRAAGSSAAAGGEPMLSGGFDVRVPRNDDEAGAARRCLARLDLSPWGNEMASPGKERLVYLADARGAAAAFRLPFGARGSIPGVTPPPEAVASSRRESGQYNRAGIRELIMTAFSDEELVTLCFDYFEPVQQQFSTGMTKGQKVQLLLDHCVRHHQVERLLARLEEHNPGMYTRFKGRLRQQ